MGAWSKEDESVCAYEDVDADAVLEVLGRFNEDLSALARAIRWGDGDALFDLFTRTRAIRRGIVALGQETAEADFGRARPAPEKAAAAPADER